MRGGGGGGGGLQEKVLWDLWEMSGFTHKRTLLIDIPEGNMGGGGAAGGDVTVRSTNHSIRTAVQSVT